MTVPTYKLFVAGEWREGAAKFQVIDPSTEDVAAEVAQASPEDVERAVAAARSALEGPWGRMTPADRGRLLHKIADLVEQHADELAALETLQTGKTLQESRFADMAFVVDALRYYSGWPTKIRGDTLPTAPGFFAFTLREPVGVVAAITPWNFPLTLAMWKVAPALAAGNAVVHKPSSLTPLTALRFAEICQEAGLPAGVYNVLPGPGAVVGEALVRHPGIDKVAFTGETSTGRHIMQLAAEGLKRVSLELGGKSPNIVFQDADLEQAARGAFQAIFYNKGEVCAAGSRLFVEESAHDVLLSKILDRVKKCVPGNPKEKNTRIGPVISRAQLEKVRAYIESGKSEGAKLIAGGDRPALAKGYFINPTVFDGVRNTMKISREEIFGPVLSVISFREADEAIRLSNDSMYGLAAGIWTRDVKKAHRLARALKAGTIWINAYHLYDPCAPFGGYKQSGMGRELGEEALREYTELKTVWFDIS